MGMLKADLEAAGFELIETHISWVFLGAAEVFKVKRPVDVGFLDFTTLEKRREACDAEVRLNRRLAPEVYIDVVPITIDAAGVHEIGGEGHGRRLGGPHAPSRGRTTLQTSYCKPASSNRATSTRLRRTSLVFTKGHGATRRHPEHGDVATIRRNVKEKLRSRLVDSISEYLSAEQAREIEAWQLEMLGNEDRFMARVDAGRVRDGHGDLRLEHVYFGTDESITIIDCIEFNDRFRYGDVSADIAFLSMDLAWHGRVDLAERFLARYARESNDYDLYSVVNFYESYRAFVRGKVASLLADDDRSVGGHARERARREARRYFMLALAYERPPLVPPRVVAVGGMIASGKSQHRSDHRNAARRSRGQLGPDAKHLMGRKPTASMQSEAWSGAYSPSATETVYEELWRLADIVLSLGAPDRARRLFSNGRDARRRPAFGGTARGPVLAGRVQRPARAHRGAPRRSAKASRRTRATPGPI